MARRSRTLISLCIVLLILIIRVTMACAEAGGTQKDISSMGVAPAMVNAFAREVAFVKSFSANCPYQFKQRSRAAEQRGGKGIDGMGPGIK